MLWFAGQLLVLLLIAFGLGLLLGYAVWISGWRKHVEEDTAGPSPITDPTLLGLGETEGPDDLTAIEGIDLRLQEALMAAGITTYVTLARSSEDVLREAIELNGLRFAPSLPTWRQQAELLARGDHARLRQLLAQVREQGVLQEDTQ